jgi:hypothetical protein
MEPINLALDIRAALLSAGMIERLAISRLTITPPDGSARLGMIIRSGVGLAICEAPNTPIATDSAIGALVTILNQEVPGQREHPIQVTSSGDCDDRSTIHIAVGSKIM